MYIYIYLYTPTPSVVVCTRFCNSCCFSNFLMLHGFAQ